MNPTQLLILINQLKENLDKKTAPGVEIVTTTKNTGKFVLWLSSIAAALVGLWKLIKL